MFAMLYCAKYLAMKVIDDCKKLKSVKNNKK